MYWELGLENLAYRRFCRRICTFYNLINGTCPSYLLQSPPDHNPNSYSIRSKAAVCQSAVRTKRFQNSFFPFCLSQANVLDSHIRNLRTINSFKRSLLKLFTPSHGSICKVNQPQGIILLTRLRVGFSHLRERKFRHNFIETLDPFCSCRTNSIETTQHYLLQCPNHSDYRSVLFDIIHDKNLMLLPINFSTASGILLFGDPSFSNDINQTILRSVTTFIPSTTRFDGSLFDDC